MIDDPRRCRFDPGTLACAGDQPSPTCLTKPQVEAARRVYRGLTDPKTGAQLYPGLAPGSEPFWPHRDRANPFPIPLSHYKWLVFADPDWDWRSFDFSDAADYAAHVKAEAKLAPILNATSPDLKAFRAARRQAAAVSRLERSADLAAEQHRLLPERAEVLRLRRGASTASIGCSWRLGWRTAAAAPVRTVSTCRRALEQWVERGSAPDQIVATRATNGIVDRSRPLCKFPATAVYSGRGDTNDAANFTCREPPR